MNAQKTWLAVVSFWFSLCAIIFVFGYLAGEQFGEKPLRPIVVPCPCNCPDLTKGARR